MAHRLQFQDIGTTAETITLTGNGNMIMVKNLEGTAQIAVRVDGIAAAYGSEGNYYLAAVAGDVIAIPLQVKESVVISLDASADCEVAAWLESV